MAGSRQLLSRGAFIVGLLICLAPQVSTAIALIIGVVSALMFTNPWPIQTAKSSASLLKLSIVGLGFALPIQQVVSTAGSSFWLTLASILFTLLIGGLLFRLIKIDGKLALLITGGTAICGGSAIAALAPTVKANNHQLLSSVAIVFLLNALALVIFPPVGHWLGFSDIEFGLWSALAIHDTSSVVGAASVWSEQALQIATTTKLARALWIIPLTLLVAVAVNHQANKQSEGSAMRSKIRIPLFIVGFILASIANGFSFVQQIAPWLVIAAKTGMKLSLFLIGYGISKESFRHLDARSWLLGVGLWVCSASFSAALIIWLR